MSKYQIYNGSSWVDICDCNLNVLNHNNIWTKIDPSKCQIRFWTGTEWCQVSCGEPLVCGGSLDISAGQEGVYYIPFTVPVGIDAVTFFVSPGGIPDGFSILTPDKTTKLASIGFVGKAGFLGWNTPQFSTKTVFTYDGNSFVQGGTEIIEFYGEGIGDPPGDTPMSNTGGLTMYNPGDSGLPQGTPVPSSLSLPNPCDSESAFQDTCYPLIFTRADVNQEEEILIQIVGGNAPQTGWKIFDVECSEREA